MGSPPPIRGARPPSQTAYYVALAGVVCLLVMLCCYFLYFLIKRVKELTAQEYCSSAPTTAARPTSGPSSYPVQPGVRDSASAMAKLCRQLPSQPVGGTVFPALDTNPPERPVADVGKIPVNPVINIPPVNETPPVR